MNRQFTITDFVVDSNLMYLIQKVTGHSTDKILSYFFGTASGVAETYLKKKNLARQVNKTLEWHYEGFDAIPYRIKVLSRWLPADTIHIKLYVSVEFPKNNAYINVTDMMNSIVESSIGLEGSEPLPNFPSPRTKVPAGFKKLIHE